MSSTISFKSITVLLTRTKVLFNDYHLSDTTRWQHPLTKTKILIIITICQLHSSDDGP